MNKESKIVGIKFDPKCSTLGMDILLRSGSVRMWPGSVYTLPSQRIEKVTPLLKRLKINFEVNFVLPYLPPMPECFSWPVGRHLAELEDWHKL